MTEDPFYPVGEFPAYRFRRMRQNETLRRLVRETRLSLDQFVMPYFLVEGRRVKEPIESMPGQFRFSQDCLLEEIEDLMNVGIRAVLLFGVPSRKDEKASGASTAGGLIPSAVREIKKSFKDLVVITDVCLCAYTNHGHCGLINTRGEIDNDGTLSVLAQMALRHAEAGSDMIAPSDMMDGRVRKIRETLDAAGFPNTPILSYSAKFASAFYGPFRDAAHSVPGFGDRKSYQMEAANLNEALREIASDIQEGADMVMVKPALAYLDVIREVSQTFQFPLAAYSVSGEYAMIKAASEKGFMDEKAAVLEIMTALARAGAGVLITYYAKEIALWRSTDKTLQLLIPQ